MKLSVIDEQLVRAYALQNEELLASVISPGVETVHSEEQFYGEPVTMAMFLAFVKSLSGVLGAAVLITKTLSSAEQLFKWLRARMSGADHEWKPSLRERILILAFEAHVNRKEGVRPEALSTTLGADVSSVMDALEALKAHGVVRVARDRSWKFVRRA